MSAGPRRHAARWWRAVGAPQRALGARPQRREHRRVQTTGLTSDSHRAQAKKRIRAKLLQVETRGSKSLCRYVNKILYHQMLQLNGVG